MSMTVDPMSWLIRHEAQLRRPPGRRTITRCLRPPHRAAQDPRCLRPPHRAAQDPPLSAATTPRSTRPPAVCGHHTAQHKTPVTEPTGSVNRDVIKASKRDVHMCK
ncbi:hypothetical protein FI667_g9799, partial [Globisporangium splendens]